MTSSSRPTGVELGAAIRRLVHRSAGVPAAGRSQARDQHMVVLVRNRYPEAAGLGQAPVLALLRHPGPGTCSWCAAEVLAVALGEPAPNPASPILQGLLGHQCPRHRARVDAARARRRQALHAAGLQWFKGRPLAPTGVVWTGREPPAVTAALTAAIHHPIPTPAYYRRRGWPDERGPA